MCFAHGGILVPYWILPILVSAGRSRQVSLKPPRAKEKPWRPNKHTGTPWEYALFAQSRLFVLPLLMIHEKLVTFRVEAS